MTASLACLRELTATDGGARMRMLGEKLLDGMLARVST